MHNPCVVAQGLGMLLTVLGLSFIFNQAHMRKVLVAISENHAIQFVAAIIPLLVGSFVIALHNVWVANWDVLATIVGWALFVIGTVRAIFPAFFAARLKQSNQTIPIAAIGVLGLLLGLALLYVGLDIKF